MGYTPYSPSYSHTKPTHHDRLGSYPTSYGYACGYVCNIDWVSRLGTKPMAQIYMAHGVYFVRPKDGTGVSCDVALKSKFEVNQVIKWLYRGMAETQKTGY